MKTNGPRHSSIEKEGGYRFPRISAKLFPCIRLGKDVIGQTLSADPSIGFLSDSKYNFRVAHGRILPSLELLSKRVASD
jgi:hypothetical protein